MESGDSKIIKPSSFLPHRSRVVKYITKTEQVPEELGKSYECMKQRAKDVFLKLV